MIFFSAKLGVSFFCAPMLAPSPDKILQQALDMSAALLDLMSQCLTRQM